ncbi:TIGR04283 family arsenosugar biosynthesis glycosyltransferase [Candidatus Parabeggiatoa sp. HSG14]|uniref:TIGR04283 family arsenosugar biosynthesis glycosyltransferase n=1 Tax=Candidatus Parabeggiatoa sp. HSG14 TaxID=3055593 RepID=UPI0025A83E9D|nr:TIGR04283 family arsenosugar biosynthesis glycosyltransferase [Thiotrichales bacterium HSG14]
MSSTLSIIIPTFNEQAFIVETLKALQPLREAGHEVIVVDGNSIDNTRSLAAPLADSVLLTSCGRARQMNIGAQFAHNDILLFLHADTLLPIQADNLIINGLTKTERYWGRFNVRLSGQMPLLRVVERLMNWRSYLTGIATGDQAIFVQRTLYFQIQGFPNIPLMEDIALSRHLKHFGYPLCIKKPVITSSRRWEQRGVIRTVLLMWGLRLAYAVGVNPHFLKKFYN